MDSKQQCRNSIMEENDSNLTSGAIKKKPSKFTKGKNSPLASAKSKKDVTGQQVKKEPAVRAVEKSVAAALIQTVQKGSPEGNEVLSGGRDAIKKGRKKTREPQTKHSVSSPASRQRYSDSKTPDSACAPTERSWPLPRSYNLPPSKKFQQKGKVPQKNLKFEPYIPLFQVQQGLKRGEFIEGALRINPRNYEDAYINAPDGQMDIYIGGMRDRNRALNGDLVVVQVNPKQEWKVLCDAIKDYQGKHGPIFVEEVYSPASSPCKVHTPERFSKLTSGASSMWNEAAGPRLPDSLEILGVDKLAEQLGELSVQPKKKNRSKRHRMRNKNKASTSSNESSNPQSSTTSYSHGSSDDILNQISPSNTPEHLREITDIATNVHNGMQDLPNKDVKEDNNVNGISTGHPLLSDFRQSGEIDEPPQCTGNSENCHNSHPSQETSWTATENQSINIVIPPDVLLDFSNDNQLQQLCDQYLPETCKLSDENDDHDGAIIVAPGDLSGDEFTDSASTSSSPSHLNEQATEDKEFFVCQQDAQNNNSDNLWNQPVDVHNVSYLNSAKLHTGPIPAEDFGSVICQREPVISNVSDQSSIEIHLQPMKLMPVHSYDAGNEFVSQVVPSPVSTSALFKTSKHRKKIASVPKLKKRKRSKSKKSNRKTDNSPDAPVAAATRAVESLTVEEVMTHPLWPKFIQKTGKVVYILERKHSAIAMGHIKLLQDKNPRYALFSPKDNRLPRMMVPMSDCPNMFYERPQDFKHFLYLACLEEWKEESTFATGRLIKSLGHVQQIGAQTEGILHENGVDFREFLPDVTACLPNSANWVIPDTEIARRVDYRNKCVFTIDPATARDMDDAVSFEVLENGNFEIGVHIADVTYFVHEGTVLDEWAKQRATSVYLVQMVVPMLPRVLCDDLCSLTPGKDRLTFSVIWEMNHHAEVLSHRFERSIINSCIKLSYEHAQEMIENPNKKWDSSEHPALYGPFEISAVIERVNLLHRCAVEMRRRRFDNGALQLNQVKLQFSLSQETGFPLGFSIYEQKDSNRLIEEFMLLANMTVAEQIYKTFPQLALLRRHPSPQAKPMEDVVKACAQMGIHLDSSSSGALQDSISRYIGDDCLSSARHLVLTHLCSKPMNCALYFCTGVLKDKELFHHYALSVPFYTHFTSPIRRYPDIIVHRLLSASLGQCPSPKVEPHVIQKQAEHCNDKKYNAKRVSELSDELFLAAFILKSGTVATQAMVISVLDHSFDCLVLQYGIVKRIYCDKLPLIEKKFAKHQGAHSLTLLWKDTGSCSQVRQTILMFSLVNITLTTNDELQIIGTLQRPSNTLLC